MYQTNSVRNEQVSLVLTYQFLQVVVDPKGTTIYGGEE